MADQEPTNDGGNDVGSTQPVAVVHVTPPQSVSVKNSMPMDGIPPQVVDAFNTQRHQMAKKNSKPAEKPKPAIIVKPPDSVPVKFNEHKKDDKKKK